MLLFRIVGGGRIPGYPKSVAGCNKKRYRVPQKIIGN